MAMYFEDALGGNAHYVSGLLLAGLKSSAGFAVSGWEYRGRGAEFGVMH
jgi:hypothetical protein